MAEVKPLLSKSLASFLSAGVEDRPDFLQYLEETLTDGNCGEIEQAMILRRRQKETLAELDRLTDGWGEMQANLAMKSLLVPGRVIIDNRMRYWLVYNSRHREGRDGVMVAAVGDKAKLKSGRLRLKFLPIQPDRPGHPDRGRDEERPGDGSGAQIPGRPTTIPRSGRNTLTVTRLTRRWIRPDFRRRRDLERTLAESPCRRCPLEKTLLLQIQKRPGAGR